MATRDAAILEVLQEIRNRTRTHVSVSVSDATALGIALSCSMTDSESLVDFSYERGVRSDVAAAVDKLAITDDEFSVLFGIGEGTRSSRAASQLRALELLPEAEQLRTKLIGALTTTMQEHGPQTAWKMSPILRVAAVTALCRHGNVEACLGAILGGFNIADSRTLEDLRSTMEDEGCCSILLSQAISALAATVV